MFFKQLVLEIKLTTKEMLSKQRTEKTVNDKSSNLFLEITPYKNGKYVADRCVYLKTDFNMLIIRLLSNIIVEAR